MPAPRHRLALPAVLLALLLLASTPAPATAKGAGGGDAGEVLGRFPGASPWSDGGRVAYVAPDGSLRLFDAWANRTTALEPALPAEADGVPAELRLAGQRLAFVLGNRLVEGPLEGGLTVVAQAAASPSLADDGSVAWLASADGRVDVWLRDGATGTPRAVTADAFNQADPVLDDSRLAWVDSRNTSPLVLLRDAVDAPAGLPPPVVDAAAALHPSNLDLYVLDRASGATVQATDEPLEQFDPVLAGDELAYLSTQDGRYELFHRPAAQGVAAPRSAAGDPAWTARLIAADGPRVVVLGGPSHDGRLHVASLDGGADADVPVPIVNALGLSADQGLVALEAIGASVQREVLVVRLPSSLSVTFHAAEGECHVVRVVGAIGTPHAWQQGVAGGEATELPRSADGAFRACGDGPVRVADQRGATAWLAIDGGASGPGAPGIGVVMLAGALLVAAYAVRRRNT